MRIFKMLLRTGPQVLTAARHFGQFSDDPVRRFLVE